MTLEQMTREVLEAWTAEHRALVRQWPRDALLEQAKAVAEMAQAEAAGSGISEREALMLLLGQYPSPGELPEADNIGE